MFLSDICESVRWADENANIESANSKILNYCPKSQTFHVSHKARILSCIADINAVKPGGEIFINWRRKFMQEYGLI